MTLLLSLLLAAETIGLTAPLELKAYLDAPSPWYPSQEGTFIYEIRFKGEIRLSSESLPLLEAAGFEKIGDKLFEERDELDYRVQRIYQRVRPKEAGSLLFGASHLEGLLYRGPTARERVESRLPPLQVEVTPFPEEGRPPLFGGSVGRFSFSLERVGRGETQVGDWITFQWSARGGGGGSLVPPPIACQPGVAGFFRLDDLPIQMEGEGEERHFTFRLAPLIQGIEELPHLSWSSFDPISKRYETFSSEKIPLEPRRERFSLPSPPPSVVIPKISLPALEGLESLYERGELELLLWRLQEALRVSPWSLEIRRSLRELEGASGLPESPFPWPYLLLELMRLLLLPALLFALWRGSPLATLLSLLLSLFFLSPWSEERRAIVLEGCLPEGEGSRPFLRGESVSLLRREGERAFIASERASGSVQSSKLLEIRGHLFSPPPPMP